jgi:hypothetical protein
MLRLISLFAFSLLALSILPLGCKTVTRCEGHEDCSADELCLFSRGECGAKCDPAQVDTCPGEATCDQCGTSTCWGCRDCAAVCVEPISQGGQGGPGGW